MCLLYPRSSAFILGPYVFRLLTHLIEVFLLRCSMRRIEAWPPCDGMLRLESKSFDFRAQIFNLTNTPSFSTPGGSTNLATGGQVTSTRNKPRLYEFGLKFTF